MMYSPIYYLWLSIILPLLAIFSGFQSPPKPSPSVPQEIVKPQEVRPLPGQLNNVAVFRSNNPEVIQEEGILLSTFPSTGKATPKAHLNYAFEGRFNLFVHHIAKEEKPIGEKTLYIGVILHNPSNDPVTIDILSAAAYQTQPDAPYINLPAQVRNPRGNIYSGPGSRVTTEILFQEHQNIFPQQIVIPPGESQLLLNLPISLKGIDSTEDLDTLLNGLSTYVRLESSGEVYVASLAMFALNPPTLNQWQHLLQTGDLARPRTPAPSPPDKEEGTFRYGRVAGVAIGSQWNARLSDPNQKFLTIAQPGEAFSYAINTVPHGTLETDRVQSAPLAVRYPDTAYLAYGNYGVQYNLTLPLYNPANETRTVSLSFQTPLQKDEKGLHFLQPPGEQEFFRGTIRIRYEGIQGLLHTRYYHLVQHRGQQGSPLVMLNIAPKQSRLVFVDFLYPPAATPPQVLTVRTLTERFLFLSFLNLFFQ